MVPHPNKEKYMPEELLPPRNNREAIASQRLSPLEIQKAINDVKKFVETRLETELHIVKHSTPIAFTCGTGVNDELDGTESKSAVKFTVLNKDIPRGVKPTEELNKEEAPYALECEVIQSLAKWKRIMLDRLGCQVGEGLYCDSTSIRKGYKGDVTHSAVADQWDFEVRISKEQRNVEQLKHYVRAIWKIITDAEEFILSKYPDILLRDHPTSPWRLPREITFLTSQELYDEFPDEDIHARENKAVDKYGAIFIIGMGWPMSDGSPPEEMRSPGYDDWNLNGDIMVRHPLTEYRHEISSMGIRVDKDSLWEQLKERGVLDQAELGYQKAVLEDKLPLSFGGGIGISRLMMLLLRMGHIGQVQVGVWHQDHFRQASEAGIDLIPDRLVESPAKKYLN